MLEKWSGLVLLDTFSLGGKLGVHFRFAGERRGGRWAAAGGSQREAAATICKSVKKFLDKKFDPGIYNFLRIFVDSKSGFPFFFG